MMKLRKLFEPYMARKGEILSALHNKKKKSSTSFAQQETTT
jgi:hypothetical protein